ncbi:MAG: hypothetical protein HY329_06225 [Chloroflexi bacterium]|nr:hypothetical protein [Chloroflexota bacterium]
MDTVPGTNLSEGPPARGPLRILRRRADLSAIRSGEIVYLPKRLLTGDGFLTIHSVIASGAAAIVTDAGGKTDHGTVVAAELDVSRLLIRADALALAALERHEGAEVAVAGDAVHVGGDSLDPSEPIATGGATQPIATAHSIKVNLSFPQTLARHPELPDLADGLGQVRLELVLLDVLRGQHPRRYLARHGQTALVEALATSLERLVAPFHAQGKEVWLSTNDFTPAELVQFRGGRGERLESNPALGYRGVCRSLAEPEVMLLPELLAVNVLVAKGYTRLGLFPPMTRFAEELVAWKSHVRRSGLERVKVGLQLETPGVALTFEDFAPHLDFVTFGSNDLTQFTLAVDRTDPRLAPFFDERHKAVTLLFERVLAICRQRGIESSICGQAGSNWQVLEPLFDRGLSGTSVTPRPATVQSIKRKVAEKERASRLSV